MNDLNTAVDLANIAVAANAFLMAKTAGYNGTARVFDGLTNLSVAARGILRNKTAAAQEFGVSDDMAISSAIYDAAKGIMRLRNLQQI